MDILLFISWYIVEIASTLILFKLIVGDITLTYLFISLLTGLFGLIVTLVLFVVIITIIWNDYIAKWWNRVKNKKLF